MNAHPFSLRQLQYALAVADTGGFRLAADRCHVSQPALSAQVALLESVLGVRLFERDRRGVRPTEAGADLIARARLLLTAADELASAALQLGDPLSGTLRLGVIPTIAPYLLPEAAEALRARCPRLSLLWSEERTAVLLSALREGRLDGALVAKVSGLQDLALEKIADDEFVLASARGHPLARVHGPARLAELEGQTALLLEDGHCLRDQALSLCSRGHAREAAFRATSLSTLVQMVLSGAGITLLPQMAVAVENRRGELSVRKFSDPAPRRTVVLAWRRQSARGEALRAVAAALKRGQPRLAASMTKR